MLDGACEEKGARSEVHSSRVTARERFPSDFLVGGKLGYSIGRYVVRHHAPENVDSDFSSIPVLDLPTHTFAGSIELRPDQLDLAMIGRFSNRIRPEKRVNITGYHGESLHVLL